MKLIGICRLGKDVEVRVTPSGKAVANLSLAYNYGQKDAAGNKPTQWVEAALWGDQAEKLKQYLLKGTVLNVTCRDVHIETFEGKNGHGAKLVGTVADLEFVPKQSDKSNPDEQQKPVEPTSTGAIAMPAAAKMSGFDNFDDDLIPF